VFAFYSSLVGAMQYKVFCAGEEKRDVP